MKPNKSSPSRNEKPIKMNITVPIQKSIRFFIRIFPAFLALVKPVSTMAKPACIQNTNAAPIRNHTPYTSLLMALKISSVIIVSSSFFFSALGRYESIPDISRVKLQKHQKRGLCFFEFALLRCSYKGIISNLRIYPSESSGLSDGGAYPRLKNA